MDGQKYADEIVAQAGASFEYLEGEQLERALTATQTYMSEMIEIVLGNQEGNDDISFILSNNGSNLSFAALENYNTTSSIPMDDLSGIPFVLSNNGEVLSSTPVDNPNDNLLTPTNNSNNTHLSLRRVNRPVNAISEARQYTTTEEMGDPFVERQRRRSVLSTVLQKLQEILNNAKINIKAFLANFFYWVHKLMSSIGNEISQTYRHLVGGS
ncbi:hypothetical protein BDF19DRAFT_428570, partial [Syncephalis fuscata]